MDDIVTSTRAYERWLKEQLKGDFVKKDLDKKHEKMAGDAFQFLRATYWRWAETIYEVCPELKPPKGTNGRLDVLAVGDIHVENFGTWRDAEGRLVWGVNDFDDAARMPYTIDIVRLAVSAILAEVRGFSAERICSSILRGYREGFADPCPCVLDRENRALRRKFVVKDPERKDFWKKFDPDAIAKKPPKDIAPLRRGRLRPRYTKVLDDARPDKTVTFRYFTRAAGTGSLGRPRVFGVGDWNGDLIVREAKAMLPSAWVLRHSGPQAIRCEDLARGHHRSPDPTFRLHGRVLVRRLSPNDFKIEAKPKTKKKGEINPKSVARRSLVNTQVLHAMGRDLAAIHRGTSHHGEAIKADLDTRKLKWLVAMAQAAAHAQRKDFKAWRRHYNKKT